MIANYDDTTIIECVFQQASAVFYLRAFCLLVPIRHFSLLNVNFAGACGYDFVCDGRRLVRAYLRQRRGAI